MARINILEPAVFNRIAAGEVVEKPASVVKELVENSIDAGSTQITISIKGGGIEEIKVSDNGCGIEKDDYIKVFLPHATSKVKCVEDLDAISSLGFRGEALASISSVANVELVSKFESANAGYKLCVDGGKMGEVCSWPSENGTTITVKNLFFNIPARAKFLKSVKQEQSEITNLVSRFILANPKIKFKYFADDKLIYETFASSLNDAIYGIYGKETVNNILPVEYVSDDGIKVSGYIGKPQFAKKNKTYQTLIINGRYVINYIVSMAVSTCYERYLMRGQFPFFVLNLNIPHDRLDVNVHPNKLDVKFENSNHIFGTILNAVNKALTSMNFIPEINVSTANLKTISGGVSFATELNQEKQELNRQDTASNATNINFINKKPVTTISEIETQHSIFNNQNTETGKTGNINLNKSLKDIINAKTATNYSSNEQEDPSQLKDTSDLFKVPGLLDKLEAETREVENAINLSKTQEVIQTQIELEQNVKFIGEIYNTYLIVETENSCYIIDQHAAHERLLYDRLVKQVNENNVPKQMLMLAHSLNVNVMEFDFLEANLDKLKSLGFDIDVFGKNCFRISSIPATLTGINLDDFFQDILSDLNMFKNYKNADLIIEKLMQKSCKAAVKAGKTMQESEVKSLLKLMKQENMVLSCPHGRPVMVELTQKELEKWFKRVV